jgi:hypothetical protein
VYTCSAGVTLINRFVGSPAGDNNWMVTNKSGQQRASHISTLFLGTICSCLPMWSTLHWGRSSLLAPFCPGLRSVWWRMHGEFHSPTAWQTLIRKRPLILCTIGAEKTYNGYGTLSSTFVFGTILCFKRNIVFIYFYSSYDYRWMDEPLVILFSILYELADSLQCI